MDAALEPLTGPEGVVLEVPGEKQNALAGPAPEDDGFPRLAGDQGVEAGAGSA